MYAVTSIPLVSRTRATFRNAEFGFFGVVVYTRVQTPRRCGAPLRAGVLVFVTFDSRPLRMSCWIVGKREPRGRTRTARRRKTPTGPTTHATGGHTTRQTTRALPWRRPWRPTWPVTRTTTAWPYSGNRRAPPTPPPPRCTAVGDCA